MAANDSNEAPGGSTNRIAALVGSIATGLTGKIVAVTGFIVAILAFGDAIHSGVTKSLSWTCAFGISFSWCRVPETWSDEVGGKDGAAFSPIACRSGEFLVGLYGRAGRGPIVFSMGPICKSFQVDWRHNVTPVSQERHKGDEVGSHQGDRFELTCPSNMVAIGAELSSAVVGTTFGTTSGFHEYLVLPLSLRCSSVLSVDSATWTTVTGAGERLGHASRKPFKCPTGSGVFGIKGRAGQFVDAVSLGCRR
jgi:hypothetical protein